MPMFQTEVNQSPDTPHTETEIMDQLRGRMRHAENGVPDAPAQLSKRRRSLAGFCVKCITFGLIGSS